MKLSLKVAAAVVACLAAIALLLPSIGAYSSYTPKQLPVTVRVMDTDENRPVAGATVTFFRDRVTSLENVNLPESGLAVGNAPSAVTDANGKATLTGTFSGMAKRQGDFLRGRDRYYVLGGWLKVVAKGRPVAMVWLNGQNVASRRDYDNNEPLEVIVVMNKLPAP
ncbi:MAG: hypothetical protein K8T25_00295 [Planctomycetia bacterium]|nr:hypothetical protein [Planctomycetia bacterium]